jgi:hypothetical protein
LSSYEEAEGRAYQVGNESLNWELRFLGYVTQQYTAKTVRGERRPVAAYDRILKKIPTLVKKELVHFFSADRSNAEYGLGSVPNLHSIIPLSQVANAPIFDLKAEDGVVGAHFGKVKDAATILGQISDALLRNVDVLG